MSANEEGASNGLPIVTASSSLDDEKPPAWNDGPAASATIGEIRKSLTNENNKNVPRKYLLYFTVDWLSVLPCVQTPVNAKACIYQQIL